MTTIFLNRRNIFLLFIFFFFVFLFQSCKKDKQVSNPVIKDTTKVSKFDYKENFEDSVEAKSWICKYAFVSNQNPVSDTKLNSKELVISLPSPGAWGYALRNFTGFDGKIIFTLSVATPGDSGVALLQIRNGKFIKVSNKDICTNTTNGICTNIGFTDTFSLVKTDTLQIKLSAYYIFVEWGSGYPEAAFFDNIELREQ